MDRHKTIALGQKENFKNEIKDALPRSKNRYCFSLNQANLGTTNWNDDKRASSVVLPSIVYVLKR
jgi:hypothetical protein